LRGFNFREKLERKYENSEKYFESLSKWCKTKKKSRGAKCKIHRNIDEEFEIPGGAPAPLTHTEHRPCK
jgi:hypothetical protein